MRNALLLLVALRIYAADHAAKDLPCAACHKQQTQSYYGHTQQSGNTMARALYTAAEATLLETNPNLSYRLGTFTYTLQRQGKQSIYSASNGKDSLSVPLAYAFGHGAAGQTYVFTYNNKWYESRLSFFKETGSLDLTLGAPPNPPANLLEALGREMSVKDINGCFACHTTNSIRNGSLDFNAIQAGIGCDNCHTGSAGHVAAIASSNAKAAAMPKFSKWSAEEQSEACGRCHRTWADIAANGPRGVGNVRFQPYRLANSKCYDAEDRRIGCTACHDPHSPLNKNLSSYDSRCTACHSATAARTTASKKICKQAKSDCASCHMPRIEMSGSHHLFTDHMIRIVRKNETYPN